MFRFLNLVKEIVSIEKFFKCFINSCDLWCQIWSCLFKVEHCRPKASLIWWLTLSCGDRAVHLLVIYCCIVLIYYGDGAGNKNLSENNLTLVSNLSKDLKTILSGFESQLLHCELKQVIFSNICFLVYKICDNKLPHWVVGRVKRVNTVPGTVPDTC